METRLGRFGRVVYQISDRLLTVLALATAASAPFYGLGELRADLVGSAATPPLASLAVLCLGLGLASRSLLRRDFVWIEPAKLAWSDFTDTRVIGIGRRLWAVWAIRFVVVAYLTLAATLVVAGSLRWLPVGIALFAATALLALVTARRRPGRGLRWVEQVGALLFAVLAGVLAVTTVGLGWLWLVVGLAGVGVLVAAVGSGRPRRPRAASTAGRAELVANFGERLARRMSVLFLDLLALLPAARPLPWPRLLAGRAVLARFVVAGALARRASLVLALLLVWAVAVVRLVFPLLDPVWLVGVGAYFAALPFAAALAQVRRVPGLRRWLGCTDPELRLTTAALVLIVTVLWLLVVALFGVPLTLGTGLAALLAAGAVVRTVGRPAMDYGNVGVAVSPDGNLVPTGLIVQLARGPEVLVIGLIVAGSGLAPGVVLLVVLGLAIFGTLH
ncbi:MAG TPA: hypothetical protein VHW44_04865 [Pseudonocardiaceae bacterium]|nr:hypothetical protein [Pseudonocardiaceae bacterium]